MEAWIASAWPQVWPNLVADLIWQPLALGAGLWWHHSRLRRLLADHQLQLAALHQLIEGRPTP